jgi:hypothetical protein
MEPEVNLSSAEVTSTAVDLPSGYVRLYRRLLQNPIWKQLSPEVLKVAIYFLLRANYKKTQWYDGSRAVEIPAGAFITSYRNVAEECCLSIQETRTAFKHLFATQFATYQRTYRWTLVRVTNWPTYQATDDNGQHSDQHAGQLSPNRHLTGNQQQIRSKEYILSLSSAGSPTPVDGLLGITELGLIPEAVNGRAHSAAAKNGHGCVPTLPEFIQFVAAKIHARHPKVRRDIGVEQAGKKLAEILKHKRVPASGQEAYLEQIDRNHAAMCASEGWQKEGGQFAKGLENWLAPTKERYDPAPESSAAPVNDPPRMVL